MSSAMACISRWLKIRFIIYNAHRILISHVLCRFITCSFKGQYSQADQASKRTPSQLDETEDIKCDPESDRISIDELTQLSPHNGRVTINTGAGKDVLSINAMVGRPGDSRTNYLVADLGADGNMLSMGSALGIERKRGNLVAGVIFDNTGGQGQVCFLKGNFRTRRCVGNVRQVTIFKGSR